MKRVLLLTTLALTLTACATSPTGRRQLLLNDESTVAKMGVASFADLKSKEKVDTLPTTNRYVECVAGAITRVLPANQRSGWEVVVFDSKEVNAFALPGRKIGVYTGLLKVASTPDQLAAVIGHEVGHVLAHHANERLSQQQATTGTLMLANAALGASDVKDKGAWMSVLGLGATVGVLLPYSRVHESEADQIGLELMAKAGFDPRQAVTLWQKMGQQGGERPPELLSTHPSPATRINRLKALLPSVLPLYQKAAVHPGCRQ